MKTDLRKLAAELARMDNPKARNEDIVAAQTILAALGNKLRASTDDERVSIFGALLKRAGRKAK